MKADSLTLRKLHKQFLSIQYHDSYKNRLVHIYVSMFVHIHMQLLYDMYINKYSLKLHLNI